MHYIVSRLLYSLTYSLYYLVSIFVRRCEQKFLKLELILVQFVPLSIERKTPLWVPAKSALLLAASE